jgi:hypothetical protein
MRASVPFGRGETPCISIAGACSEPGGVSQFPRLFGVGAWDFGQAFVRLTEGDFRGQLRGGEGCARVCGSPFLLAGRRFRNRPAVKADSGTASQGGSRSNPSSQGGSC